MHQPHGLGVHGQGGAGAIELEPGVIQVFLEDGEARRRGNR
jgi:hypothetical protein